MSKSRIRRLDLFANPVSAARRIYPYVVIVQADVVDIGEHRLVAPIAVWRAHVGFTHRIAPAVDIEGKRFAVMISEITPLRMRDLRTSVGSLDAWRDEIGHALDWIFFGV